MAAMACSPTAPTATSLTFRPVATAFPTATQTPDDGERNQGQSKDDGGADRSELTDWRETYRIPYTTSCMDDRLGIEVVRKFQMGKRGPTTIELQTIQSCAIERAELMPDGDSRRSSADGEKDRHEDDDEDNDVRTRIEELKAVSGGWIRTGDPKNDQFVLGYLPTPDEWRCGVAEVGVTILRDIKAGKHSITAEEGQKLEPCFRATPDSLIHPLAQFDCIPLDIMLEFVDYYRPSWEQLDCHLEGLERYDLPENQIRYLGASDPFAIRNSKGPLYPPYWDRIATDPYFAALKLNFSPSVSNMGMPPSYDEEYNAIACHYSYRDSNGNLKLNEYLLSEATRGAAIGYIIEKKKGRRIYADLDMCSNDYVVQGDLASYKFAIHTIPDFKDRTLNVLLPGYVMKAKAAEAVKAEMMQINGLKAEVEVIFTTDEFLYSLPHSEQIELAQWYLDTIIEGVRKHFYGMVWVASYANYDDGHPDFPATGMNPTFGSHWEDLSFAAADHVSFTLDATCDFAQVRRYFDVQFDAIMRIVQRDGVTWHTYAGIPENFQGPTYVKECKDEYDEIGMHEWLFAKLDELPLQPYFLTVLPPVPRSWTKDEEGYSPTQADSAKGNWRLFSLDVMEMPPELQELYMSYALTHVRE